MALLFLVLFNILGVKISQLWQYILIACTFFPLLAMIVFALFNIHTEYLTPFAPYGWWALVPAVQVVIYSFLGFECTTSLFSLVRDPEKNLPRAITLSILFTAILYIAFMAAVILSIPQSSVSYPKELISHLLAKTYPAFSWLATLIAISLVPTILGTIHSMVWGASMLVVSLINVSSASCLTCVRASAYKNQLGVLLVGAGICVSLLTFTSLNLFFSLTAVFIVSAYLSALVALLKNTRAYRLRDWVVVIGGIKVAVIIFLCAVYSLVKSF
jgi:amino acid transporter